VQAERQSLRAAAGHGLGRTMFNRISAAPPIDVGRTRAGLITFTNARSFCGLVLACLLLGGCAAAASGSSPLASEEDSLSKADPPATQVAAAGSGAGSGAAVAADPALLQRRRQTIAQMLEGNIAFRGILDDGAPRLVDAKLGGPFEYVSRKHPFSSETVTAMLYCASAGVKVGFFPAAYRIAVISVVKAGGGTERLLATIDLKSSPYECHSANYGPFPEMEQIRTARRKALRKAD
jgi:hypothetical protein